MYTLLITLIVVLVCLAWYTSYINVPMYNLMCPFARYRDMLKNKSSWTNAYDYNLTTGTVVEDQSSPFVMLKDDPTIDRAELTRYTKDGL